MRLRVCFFLLIFPLLAYGCGNSSSSDEQAPVANVETLIKVTGSQGVTFSGTYGDRGNRERVSKTKVPADLKVVNAQGQIEISLMKGTEGGTMTVEVTVGGKTTTKSTSAPFGLISFSAPID